MRPGLYWLSDEQWSLIEPHLPTGLTGPEREDDRRVLSGIVHMLQCGARWRDCPPEYGPYTTIYNRFNRWSKRGRWQPIFAALSEPLRRRSRWRSIRPRSRRTARPPAEKGGADASHRPLPWRAHDEDPRPDRSAVPAGGVSSDAGPGCRHRRCVRPVGAGPGHGRLDRRQSL